MKRLLMFVLCLTMVAACFAGCQPAAQTEAEPTAAPEAAATPEASATPEEDKVSGETVAVEETAETKYQKTVTLGVNADVVNKDIQNTSSVIDRSNSVLVFNTLIEYDTENSVCAPALATEWEQLSELEWQFKLREGVKFHSGATLTAEDVKFTFERGLEQKQTKGKINTLASVEVVDDNTVKLILTKDDPDIIFKLTDICTAILSAEAFNTLAEEEACMIGTGPFMYDEWMQGDHVTLKRFDEYWNGAAKTEEIVVKYIPEAASRLVALQTGEIDLCLEPPATDLHYVAEDESLVLYQLNGTNIRYIWMNVNVKPFDNKLVRQAISYAVNRDDVIAMVYNGNATAAYNVMHPNNEYFNSDISYQEYNVERAKELLAEAGYPDGFDCTIYCSTGNTQKSVATIMQSQLAAIGVNVTIEAQESATFSSGVAHGGTYDMAVDGWGGYVLGPDYAMRSVFYSSGTTNRCNIEDPKVDELIDAGLSSSDFETRCVSYYELQQYLMDEAVWVPLAIERINIATKNTLQGFTLPRGTTENYRNLYIVEE